MHLGARRCSTRDVGVHLERGMRGREQAAVVTRGVWWVSPGGIFSGLGLPLACGILDWDSDSAAFIARAAGAVTGPRSVQQAAPHLSATPGWATCGYGIYQHAVGLQAGGPQQGEILRSSRRIGRFHRDRQRLVRTGRSTSADQQGQRSSLQAVRHRERGCRIHSEALAREEGAGESSSSSADRDRRAGRACGGW